MLALGRFRRKKPFDGSVEGGPLRHLVPRQGAGASRGVTGRHRAGHLGKTPIYEHLFRRRLHSRGEEFAWP